MVKASMGKTIVAQGRGTPAATKTPPGGRGFSGAYLVGFKSIAKVYWSVLAVYLYPFAVAQVLTS